MKTYLKRLLIPILSGLIVCNFYSCDSDDEHTATPIAPILKEIKFPSENDIIPVRWRKSTDSDLQKKI